MVVRVREWLSGISRRLGPIATPGALHHVVGLGSIGVIVAGVWGLWGWQWAAIVGGLPSASFYLWVEARIARDARPEVGD